MSASFITNASAPWIVPKFLLLSWWGASNIFPCISSPTSNQWQFLLGVGKPRQTNTGHLPQRYGLGKTLSWATTMQSGVKALFSRIPFTKERNSSAAGWPAWGLRLTTLTQPQLQAGKAEGFSASGAKESSRFCGNLRLREEPKWEWTLLPTLTPSGSRAWRLACLEDACQMLKKNISSNYHSLTWGSQWIRLVSHLQKPHYKARASTFPDWTLKSFIIEPRIEIKLPELRANVCSFT